MKIAYFVYDLNDAAVRKRLRMLRAGGAQIALAGFYRGERPSEQVEGVAPLSLGQTFDGKMAARAAKVALSALKGRALYDEIGEADVVMARNLESLIVADRYRARLKRPAGFIYECLDIHRLMLSDGLKGEALRGLEQGLMRRADLVVVSSPAFADNYFTARQGRRERVMLVENKVLNLGADPARAAPAPGPPWRIAWFGMLRCRKSLHQLAALVKGSGGRLEAVIRGKPSANVFADFASEAASLGLSYGGVYRPEDLAELYAGCHFTWAIDYFEEGLNSSWLLPNRLYEGLYYGSAPIALEGLQTAAWLEQHQVGKVIRDPLADLPGFIRELDQAGYDQLHARSAAVPTDAVRAGRDECERLVQALGGV